MIEPYIYAQMFGKDTDINALAQAIDTTWGKSSTTECASYSITGKLSGSDRMILTYQTLVNFGSMNAIEVQKKVEHESKSMINNALKEIKKEYKELSGKTLKVKEVSSSDGYEIVSMNIFNPKRTSYYRRQTIFDVK